MGWPVGRIAKRRDKIGMPSREDTTAIRVSRSIYEDLKECVRERSGKHFKVGLYMEAANNASLRYMAVERVSNAHTQAQNLNLKANLNTPKRVINIRDKVIKYLLSDPKFEGIGIIPVRVHLNILKKAPAVATGTKGEDRTIVPWIEKFVEYSILNEVQTSVFEFLINGQDGEDLKKAAKQRQIEEEINSAFK
jgi:hypothetical protein